ncbi:hypothetical protein [Dictyobacter alpinus]|uniref:hypothetical protein n=1 Tax=Dictyobacter alpinus TaxID=2014873 RepID=UPI000F83CAE9|nr:hypothetical protein [Dictyobacter alpinus]
MRAEKISHACGAYTNLVSSTLIAPECFGGRSGDIASHTFQHDQAASTVIGVGATALRVVLAPRPTQTQQCGLACGAHSTYDRLAHTPTRRTRPHTMELG